MTILELAQRYAEKPTESRYEALVEEIFRQEATAKGIIWYNALEDINPVFCDNYSCSDCPVGHDVCDRAAKSQMELEKAIMRVLNDMGFNVDAYYNLPSREEVMEAIKEYKKKQGGLTE